MAGHESDAVGEQTRRVLRVAAFALVAVAILAVALIAAGAFDPKPFGSLIRVDQPGPMTLSTTGAFYPQSAPWPADSPPEQFSVRLRAAHANGELDSGYGLALSGDSGRLVVAVSPLGYAAVLEERNDGQQAGHRPWQPWPHVRSGEEENEIWLDVDNAAGRAQVTAWINREQLWRGEFDHALTAVELWQTTFGQPATVDFRSLEWYAGAAP